VRIRKPSRAAVAAVVTSLGIAAGSGGLALMLWGGPESAALFETGSIPPPGEARPDLSLATAPAAPPVRIDVPAIHVSSALLGLRVQDDGTLQVPGDPAQAGWWSEGTAPGDPGPAIIVGHVDSPYGPAVFYHLSALRPGDKVLIGRADGTTVAFTVDALRLYPKDEFPTDLVYGVTRTPTLRLLTCGGSFDRSTGHYTDNLVVFAHLVDTAAPSPAPAAAPNADPGHHPAGYVIGYLAAHVFHVA
jgi:sortase (surface protein transpeptidase)